MKNLCSIILFSMFYIIISHNSFSQSSSDCIGAIPFCDGDGQDEATVSPGDGNIHNDTALSCVDNEGYSTWYTFTVTSNGIFNFILTPTDLDDDYDWALFNITGHTCADVPNDDDLLVSCNSWGATGVNGTTGISTDEGGTGNSNGPGNNNGPPFNEDLNVYSGETYVLMVSNWSESTEGFNIDVSGSTAGGVYASSGIKNLDNVELCLGDDAFIDVDFVGINSGNLTYSWQPSYLFVDNTVQDPIFNQKLTESTRIKLNLQNGVCDYTVSALYSVGTIDYDFENKNIHSCVGYTPILKINFTGVEVPSGVHYSWTPSSLLKNPLSDYPTTLPLKGDTTQFYFAITNGNCSANDSLFVIAHTDTVTANFDYFKNDNASTIPIEIDFVNLSEREESVVWDFGDGTGIYTEDSPYQYQYPGYDTYEVKLTAISPSGYCFDDATATIKYPEVVYPNVISPNNDGKNDGLWIVGLKIGTAIKIFNRWGRLVFESDNYQHDWFAEDLIDGTYYLQFIDENNETKKGWIQVLR